MKSIATPLGKLMRWAGLLYTYMNMAAGTSVEEDFKTWLIETLNSSELDGEVYGDYICGVLEEGDEEEDVNLEETKRTELIDMLSGALVWSPVDNEHFVLSSNRQQEIVLPSVSP